MTAMEAFQELIHNEDYIQTLPIDQRNTIRSYKAQYETGKLKVKNIDTLLENHGFVKTHEPEWEHKSINK